MRTWIGIALGITIGLIWSIAAMSKWVPVNSAEMTSAHISEVTMGESASTK